jgi:quercetin dioxygenase-like cupin family protein
MKRMLGVAVLVGAAALTVLAVTAFGGTAHRAQPTGVTITPLAHATIATPVRTSSSGIQIKTHGPKDMLVTSIVVDPGGSFGWHTHPGPVLVSVAAGTLSLYHAEHRRHCHRDTVTAGQGFIEDGGDVHLARNEGTTPVQLYVTFLARPGTTEFLTEVAAPAACSGL